MVEEVSVSEQSAKGTGQQESGSQVATAMNEMQSTGPRGGSATPRDRLGRPQVSRTSTQGNQVVQRHRQHTEQVSRQIEQAGERGAAT